jgi:hypothetical protein
MKLGWPVVVFGIAFLLPLALLYWHRAKAWYLHVISVLLAVGIAVIPDPKGKLPMLASVGENTVYLTIGFVCVFLGVWGLAAPLFRGTRGRRA